MRDAEAVLTSQSNSRSATVDLLLDDSGTQTWKKINGFLNLNSAGGVWRLGGWTDSATRLVALFDGSDYVPAKVVAVLQRVPAQFIDSFCSSYSGNGSLTAGLDEIDKISWAMDVNPCN
jgi:hypothetical protein